MYAILGASKIENQQQFMSRPSPTIEGFRAIFRQPSLIIAEISWRWALGATAAVLALFYSVEYLDTLPVTSADATLLSTRQPALVGRAIAHILRGSLNRAVLAALLVALSLSSLWIIAASVGRLATVRALLDYFRGDVTYFSANASVGQEPRPIQALIVLNCLRLMLFLAVILALGGAAILIGFVSTSTNPRPGLGIILFVPLAAFICIVGWMLNWWLMLAGIFAVRDGEDALASTSAAVTFSREHLGSVCAVSTWTGLAHLVAFSIATSVAAFPLAFAQVMPARLVIAAIILVTLAYFAIVDWLYMVRLAGYVCIAEMPPALAAAVPVSPGPLSESKTQVETSIDHTEPILSDLPNLAAET
ncbi:MAG: hypothetical protein WCD47_07225 [Candidatus Sulfotelmatobacter sp.]